MSEWIPCVKQLPDDGTLVMTKIDNEDGLRNEAELTRRGNLWFSGEMYVYYRPTHWRPIK
jgi:Protein of unknown function (DUF551)